jgi:type-F conjugative transfer system pilin assembly protein TrbC
MDSRIKKQSVTKHGTLFGNSTRTAKRKPVLKQKIFNAVVAASQNYFSSINSQEETDIVKALSLRPVNSQSSTAIYVFVSLSMPKPALIALNKEAAQLGAALVLRGLKDNSYQKTAFYLQDMIEKTGQGFLIHPELFKRYEIHQVPSVVLATDTLSAEPIFDVVSGHIPIKTALLEIAEKGELKNEAKDWLQRGGYAD